MKTARQILKKHYPIDVAKTDDLLNNILEAMEEYASQFKSKEVTDEGLRVTDEEIEKWADEKAIAIIGTSKHGHIIKAALFTGAKAMRDGKIK